MKRDEVLKTLREVIAEAENFTTWTVSTPHLVELVKRAVEAEREACAKIADAAEKYNRYISKEIAEDIRARGNT